MLLSDALHLSSDVQSYALRRHPVLRRFRVEGGLGTWAGRRSDRDLSACDYVYGWVDGIHVNIQLEDDRLCTLVMIESPFATVRLRQRVRKGAGSRTKGLVMAFTLLEMAQRRCAPPERRPSAALGACRRPVRRWPHARTWTLPAGQDLASGAGQLGGDPASLEDERQQPAA